MKMSDIPFGTTDWSTLEETEHKGETGMAYWRTRHLAISVCAWSSTHPGTWQTTGV